MSAIIERFEAEIGEICRDPLSCEGGDAARSLPATEIAEMVKGDPNPLFVILTFMREGLGRGKPRPKWYRKSAVESAPGVSLGAISYLGHQKPENRDTEYRVPQGRCVRAWCETVTDKEGRQVRVAKGKVYLSRASEPLRTHIQEGMAGPVSWTGRAVLVPAGEDLQVETVQEVRTIDFCNPGTPGIDGAGVERVVNEMKTEEGSMSRLTKEQLLAEYGAEIREMIREAVDKALESPATKVAEMTSKVTAAEAAAAKSAAELAEAKKLVEARDKEVAEMREAIAESDERMALADLEKHRDAQIAEIKDVADQVRETLKKRVKVAIAEGDSDDLAKSKAAIDSAIEEELAEIRSIAEMTGGTIDKRRQPPAAASGRPARSGTGASGRQDKRVTADLILASRGRKREGRSENDKD